MTSANNKKDIAIIVIFWIIVAFVIIAVSNIFLEQISFMISMFILAGLAAILGLVLIILTAKTDYRRIAKSFLILTGSSALGFIIGSVLHNLIYALFMTINGGKIVQGIGEVLSASFFIISVVISPVAFLVGVVGAIVVFALKMKR